MLQTTLTISIDVTVYSMRHSKSVNLLKSADFWQSYCKN